MPYPVNSPGAELLPRFDPEGRLIFGSSREGSAGGGDMYRATRSGDGAWRVERLPYPISGPGYEYEDDISRDGSTMVIVSNRGMRSHLFHFTKTANGWYETGQIPADDTVFQIGPTLSPKGDRLIFAQRHGDRSGEMFLIDLVAEPDRSWPPDCR